MGQNIDGPHFRSATSKPIPSNRSDGRRRYHDDGNRPPATKAAAFLPGGEQSRRLSHRRSAAGSSLIAPASVRTVKGSLLRCLRKGTSESWTFRPPAAAGAVEHGGIFLELGSMNKLLELGRKAWFVIRVMSGYEERMIRFQRSELQRRFEVAQAKKEALRKVPEQAILAEVRQMVEEMESLNKKLDETEAAIEEYFKPLDKEAEIIMNMQLKEEEKTMKMMVKAMEEQAFEKVILGSTSKVINHEGTQQESPGTTSDHVDDVLTK